MADDKTNELREATDEFVAEAAEAQAQAAEDGPAPGGTIIAGDARHGNTVIGLPDEEGNAQVTQVDDPPRIVQGGEATEAPELADARQS